MKIPKVGALVTIIHKGVEQKVFVEAVTREIGSLWRILVHAGQDIYANGDEVTWAAEGGNPGQTFVRDLNRQDGEIFFALVAGETW